MQVMRNRLESLLPNELIQDEYGTVTSIKAVSSQHLARLQGKVWRELPQMVATTASGFKGDITEQCLIVAQSVWYIADAMTKRNSAFILHPRSKQPCHSALCQSIHENLNHSYSPHEVTFEPLVDWMTLDPVLDVTPVWFTLYRRNRKLLEKFALSNSIFIPRNPVRLCFECLLFLAEERNVAWYMMKDNPNILSFQVPLRWPKSDDGGDAYMDEEGLSSDSDSSTSDQTVVSLTPIAEREPEIPDVDGAFNGWGKPLSKKFEIWRDPTPDEEQKASSLVFHCDMQSTSRPSDHPNTIFTQYQLVNPLNRALEPVNRIEDCRFKGVAGWTPISIATTLRTSSLYVRIQLLTKGHKTSSITQYKMHPSTMTPFQGTFAKSEAEKYPAARAGFPTRPAEMYECKRGITFMVAPMIDCGPMQSGLLAGEPSDDLDVKEADEASRDSERYFGAELGPNIDIANRLPKSLSFDLVSNVEAAGVTKGVEALRSPQTPYNSARHSDFPWPASKESTSPVPARPVRGSDVTPKHLYPRSTQLICLCKKAAETDKLRIVQCRNPECFVGWYHYTCLDYRGKGSARHGTLLCDLCMGNEYWGKAEGVADLSMPFTRDEIMREVTGVLAGSKHEDPYGLRTGNGEQEFDEGSDVHQEEYETIFHEDEEDEEDKKNRTHGEEKDEADEQGLMELADKSIDVDGIEETDRDTVGETIGETDEERDEETEEEAEEEAEEGTEEETDEETNEETKDDIVENIEEEEATVVVVN